MKPAVLHQTSDYVVCVKPQGIESEHEMPRLLREILECDTVYPVHRLDKETGGVMVYAKTKWAAAELTREVQNGKMQKTYLAVVKGIPQPAEGRWDDWLFRDRQKNKSYLVQRERKGVKKASLSYEVLEQGKWNDQTVSLVKIRLHTGRTHQIRVQFSGRNHPLIGDRRYGGMPCENLALWSTELRFFDRLEEQRFICTPQDDGIWTQFIISIQNHNSK